ncbi:spore gernimation protein [Paenibacillus sambharensis]|uniref:Spore gernimation protein n=1 Tax=Paenibacillus sambharensis TaxID=1803190 RepID=A0A2W1LB33_9BACL|nr:GerAB/ArcD/ProY family transporter [Paenibacillus sambharensis]PZD97458.1 spore gernimation protein [Paenibacillus sambharensis]
MKIQIPSGMLLALVINIVYAKAIGVTQGIMAREVGSDMWIATLAATAQGMVIMALTAAVLRKHPDCDFITFAEKQLGGWFGKLVAVLIFAFFLFSFGPIMVTFVYHLKDYFLPEAPTILFVLVGCIVGVYGCYLGLEVMGRMAYVGLASIMLLNTLLLIGSMHEFDIQNLRPVLESSASSILWASRQHNTDWAMATLMTAIILPYVRSPAKRGRAGVIGMVYGGLFILMWPLLETGVLSASVTSEYIVACMQMARSAHIGQFLHRYEMIMIALFATSALIQIMMSLYCASFCLMRITGRSDYRPMIIPVSLLLGGFGYWLVDDHLRAMSFTDNYWPLICMPIAFGLPVLLWLVSLIKRRRIA